MNISSIKTILLSCAAAVAAAGCTDLDVDIQSQYTGVPDTPEAIEAVTAVIYNPYREAMGRQHWMAQTLSSDEAAGVSMGADYYDGGVYRQMTVHNWNADNGMLDTMWDGAMTGITTCNQILRMLSGKGGGRPCAGACHAGMVPLPADGQLRRRANHG